MTDLIEKSIKEASSYFQNFFSQEYFREGFLQKVDVRIKLIGIFILLLASISTFDFSKTFTIFFSALVLAKLSNIRIKLLLSRIWLFTLFAFIIVIPRAFMGVKDFYFLSFGEFVYAIIFTFRVVTAITLLQLLILTTPFNQILAAFKSFKIPQQFVFILGLTYRYIHLMFSELLRILVARESRRIKKTGFVEVWRFGGKSLGSFFIRTFEKGEKVQLAMNARGNDIKSYIKPFSFTQSEMLFTIFVLFALTWWIMI